MNLKSLRLGIILAGILLFSYIFPRFTFASNDLIGAWQSVTPLPVSIASHASFSNTNKVYVIGGANVVDSSEIRQNEISSGGLPIGSWSSQLESLPHTRYWSAMVSKNDYVYLLGGASLQLSGGYTETVYRGQINNDQLSSWTSQTSLPSNLSLGASAISGEYIFFSGGFNGSGTSNKVYSAPLDESGNIGLWEEVISLPSPVMGHAMIEHNGSLYVMGGADTSGSYFSKVYKSNVNSDGTITSWTEISSFPHAVYRGSVVKIDDSILMIGGHDGASTLDTIYYSKISPDGLISPWALSENSLPAGVSAASATKVGNFIYLLGGYRGGYLNSVYVTELNVNSSPTEIDLGVPKFMQTDSAWGSHIYDSAHLWSPTTPTISAWGCAMTSAAMVFNYHKITKLPNNEELNPGNLNGWLKAQPDGYVGSGWVNWLALSRLSKQAKSKNPQFNYDALEFKRVNGFNPVQLKTDLENSIPGILEVPGHFIVANGALGDSFSIRDPFYSDRNSLSSYSDTFLTLNRFVPSNTDLSYMMFLIEDEMTIVVKDDAGNVIGEGFTQQPLDEDGGDKKSGKPMYVYYVPQPIDGKYSVEILGNGLYNLESYIYDKNGEVKKVAHAGVTTNSSPDTLVIDFDKDDVSQIKSSEVVTFKNLLADLDFFYKIKTIKNQGIYIALREKVVKAEKYEKKSKIVSKNLMLAFLLELNGVPKALITNDARSILKLQSQILYDSL